MTVNNNILIIGMRDQLLRIDREHPDQPDGEKSKQLKTMAGILERFLTLVSD